MSSRILAVVAFAVALGIFFFYINPTLSGPIASAKLDIASDENALAAADTFTAQVKKLSDAQKAVGPANIARLELLLPDSIDNVGLIIDLNALAARSGLHAANIDVAPVAKASDAAPANAADTGSVSAGPYQSLSFTLSALGSYTALKTFLSSLEKSQRLLDIQDLTVQGSDTGIYTYTMNIRLYWLR